MCHLAWKDVTINDSDSDSMDEGASEGEESNEEEEWKEELAKEERKKKPKKNNMRDNKELIECMARFPAASERMAAAFANATHKDDGIDLDANPSMIVGKSKVHLGKKNQMTRLSMEPAKPTDTFFFDGKKFPTMHSDHVEDLYHRHQEQVEDHYVMADGRNEEYLGDITVEKGTGEAIADGIIDFIDKKEGLEMEEMKIFGGDSTNVNIGKNIGVIATIEKKTNLSFHRFICILHLIELLLRHYVNYFVGDTSGPRSFSSSLGKAIVNLKDPVIAAFKRIPCPHFPIISEDILAVGGALLL